MVISRRDDRAPALPRTMTSDPAAPAPRRRWVSFGLGVAGLGAAALGERAVHTVGTGGSLALPLYLAGIALFAWQAWPIPAPAGTGVAPPRPRRAWAITGAGLAVAIVLCGLMVRELRIDFASPRAVTLWLSCLVALLATGLLAGRGTGWAPLWEPPPVTGRARRIAFAAALLGIVAIGFAARFLWLDRIPFGMNADEGDQGAVAIRIARNNYGASVFGAGWYHISNVYFWVLAQFMKVFGLDLVGARTLGAACSAITLLAVLWLLRRHFGARAALLGGLVFALLGAALQFARFTTCATPLAMLWTISVALFLEAARRGAMWAWIGAGVAGGLSIYTYPTGRLWPVIAALFGIYLLVHGLGRRRWAITGGLAAAAVASILTMTPFFLHVSQNPALFVIRARETSIFVKENPYRLGYYKPEWTLQQLLVAQVKRSFAIFDQISDQNYLWPSDRPITPGFLGVLTLLGLGAVALRARDPRLVLLSIWFWLGFIGVIITVETPSLHRMTGAIPVIAILPALVLDELARRAESLPALPRPWLSALTSAGAGLVAVALMALEARFYFVDYARMDRWIFPTQFGLAVGREEGNLTLCVGRYWHHINAGWVRLLGANTFRGALMSPGSMLPLAAPANKGLTFVLFNLQGIYAPYLAELYPGGTLDPLMHRQDGKLLSMFHVGKEAWRAQRGALASVDGAPPRPVRSLGDLPPGVERFPARARWVASLRVTRFWNYVFRVGPGPARLELDGRTLLTVPEGSGARTVALSLPRGDHQVVVEAAVPSRDAAPAIEWAPLPSSGLPAFRPVLPALLTRREGPPRGLLGTFISPGRPMQLRVDGTLATGGLQSDVGVTEGSVRWTGTLLAPTSGLYQMRLASQGAAEVRIDGRVALAMPGTDEEKPPAVDLDLTAGAHPIEICLDLAYGKPNAVEWRWTTPGELESIVPPSALAPPPGAGVGPALPWLALGPPDLQPADQPFSIEW